MIAIKLIWILQVYAAPLKEIDFSRPKPKSLPKNITQPSAGAASFSYGDPLSGEDNLTLSELEELFNIHPEACVFKHIDCGQLQKV